MINVAIERRAEKLLSDSGSSTLPIDIFKCARFLNISINNIALEDNISGFLAIKDKSAHIGYNENHGNNRQRFTVAHEIGHYLLHAEFEPLFIDKNEEKNFTFLFRDGNSSTGAYRKEKEANGFAAALLMPKRLLLQEIGASESKDNPTELVRQLADRFGVSEQAIRIRLSQLGYFDYDNIEM